MPEGFPTVWLRHTVFVRPSLGHIGGVGTFCPRGTVLLGWAHTRFTRDEGSARPLLSHLRVAYPSGRKKPAASAPGAQAAGEMEFGPGGGGLGGAEGQRLVADHAEGRREGGSLAALGQRAVAGRV